MVEDMELKIIASRSTMWDLWWTKLHWDRFFSEFFGFTPASHHSIISPYSCITAHEVCVKLDQAAHCYTVGLLQRDYMAYIPEGCYLHTRRRENLKSSTTFLIFGYL
jgi:hypothetical protein